MIDMMNGPDGQQGSLLGADANKPNYPYGLRITLDPDTLRKLAMGDGNMPQVGQQFELDALVEVIAVSMDDGQSNVGYSMTLQITAMELCPPGEEEENPGQAALDQISKMYDC
mgnify:FL=1